MSQIVSVNNPIERAINHTMTYWYGKETNYTDIPFKIRHIGMFDYPPELQMISGNAVAMGCGMVKGASYYFVACTYDSGIVSNEPLYEVGEVGSKCQTGMNPKYDGLCSINEFPINATESPLVKKWIDNGKMVPTIEEVADEAWYKFLFAINIFEQKYCFETKFLDSYNE